MLRKLLLTCGILAALLYVGADIRAAMRVGWEGFGFFPQTLVDASMLRPIWSPARSLLPLVLLAYMLLEIAFAVGVLLSAGPKRSLRLAGGSLLAIGLLDLLLYFPGLLGVWPFPGETMQLVLTSAGILLVLLAIGCGANADGRPFRIYSYATIAVLIACAAWGVWAYLSTPPVDAYSPSVWTGVRERINVFSYMLWQALLAVMLWRAHPIATAPQPPTGVGRPLAHTG